MSLCRKPSERAEMLTQVPFFDGFGEEDILRVVDLTDEVQLPAGSVVVDQGDPGTDCFVILDGTASVYVRGDHVASSGPGSMVGEMALVDHRPRTATVVADTDLDMLRFDSTAFRKLLDEMPKASERIMTTLRARLDRLGTA
ncbi:MAG: cyclic nucleotide-binding domain-containing protein [Actinomycetes bacterium]